MKLQAHIVQLGSVFLIWLFHVSAIIGVLAGFGDWFISLSPLNLLLCVLLVAINNDIRQNLVLLIPFFVGMLAEIIGVQTGILFGEYAYGEMLGWKILGVPWLIGCNWALLVYSSAVVANLSGGSIWIRSLVGASLMVLLDIVMEPIAPRIDYWLFDGNQVPLKNYIHWFVVGTVAHLLYLRSGGKKDGILGWNLLLAFFIFFLVLLFI
jgi:bisanhydrobacterioruberin hydratase